MAEQPIDQCYCSVDETDCPENEPALFSTARYNHKINSAALRYKIAVSFIRCNIVSVNEPRPAGSYWDLKIFRGGLWKKLDEDEFAIADNECPDFRFIQPPNHHPPNELYTKNRSRHDVLNSSLKHFGVLTKTFRHELRFHGTCFHTTSNITALDAYQFLCSLLTKFISSVS